jgi:glycosyltransferase involved in cell wall biosynthesis
MKVLYLCQKSPYPPKDGGAIGTSNVLMGLSEQGHQLNTIAINSPKHRIKIEDVPQDYREKTNLQLVDVNTNVNILKAFFNLFTKKSYNIARFYTKKMEAEISILMKNNKYDIVIVDSIFMKDYLALLRANTDAKIILRSPNIEYKIWERMAEYASFLKKRYLKLLASRLKKEELISSKLFDGMFTVTSVDKQYFVDNGMTNPIQVIPTGIDMLKKEKNEKKGKKDIDFFHIGSMDWMPNIEAVDFLLDEIWPKIQKEFPDSKLYIAGRNTSEELLQHKQDGVVVLGEVESAADFIDNHSVMLVPLLSGSGQRVKVVEGMMMGKLIISTRLGVEGIDVEDGENILLAETGDDFLQAVKRIMVDKDLVNTISKNAIAFADKNYNNKTIAENLETFLISFIE